MSKAAEDAAYRPFAIEAPPTMAFWDRVDAAGAGYYIKVHLFFCARDPLLSKAKHTTKGHPTDTKIRKWQERRSARGEDVRRCVWRARVTMARKRDRVNEPSVTSHGQRRSSLKLAGESNPTRCASHNIAP